MRVRIAACERYRLRVTTWGSGASPHAIVLPGLSADWRALAPQIRALRRLGWTVHVVDLPGFALPPSLAAADATFAGLAGIVGRVATDLGISRALLVGHSLGGGVAMQLALARPALAMGMVLIAPAGLGRSLHWIYKLYCFPLLGRALLRPGRVLTASSIRRFLVGSTRRNDPKFVARLVRHGSERKARSLSTRAIIWANQPRRWHRALALLPGGEQLGFRIDERLSELGTVPALVLWGNEDRVISVQDAKRCAGLPLAEIHIAVGVGHSLPLEAAAWANEHIARFASSLTSTELRAA